MEEDVLKILKKITGKRFGKDDQLIHGGLLRSIEFIQAIVSIEKEFQIQFSDEDYLSGNLDSVELICICINRHKSSRSS